MLGVLGLASATTVQAQIVEGHVRDATSGRYVPDAQVSFLDDEGAVVADAVTDIGGRFLIEVDRLGQLTIYISRAGYFGVSEVVDVEQAATHGVGVRLTPIQSSDSVVVYVDAPSLPPLDSLGFYNRARTGRGTFYTHFDLREMEDVWTLQDVLLLLPDASVAGRSRTRVMFRNELGGTCSPGVYIDGFPFQGVRRGNDEVPLTTVEGIEIYRASEVPGRFPILARIGPFGGTLPCGLVVVWTQHWTALPR